MAKIHHKNIQAELLQLLAGAKQRIWVAVAWLTDKDLIAGLARAAGAGVAVRVLVNDDVINAQYGHYQAIVQKGGQVNKIATANPKALMHHKFCVLDSQIAVSGSYNWSVKAQGNHEHIVVIHDPQAAAEFEHIFEDIYAQYFEKAPVQAVDIAQVLKRLQLLQQAADLQDAEDIHTQVAKINKLLQPPIPEELEDLELILDGFEAGKHEKAAKALAGWLKRYSPSTALTVAAPVQDFELFGLRLRIKDLELQLSSLETEKMDILQNLQAFEQAYYQALGDLIIQILDLRQKLAAQEAAAFPNDAEKQAQARQTAEDYEQSRTAPPKPKVDSLPETEKAQLRALYRQAAKLCHPDTVANENESGDSERSRTAHLLFQQLNQAYEAGNIQKVSEILTQLQQKGGVQNPANLDAASLRAKIERLERAIQKLSIEIQQIRENSHLEIAQSPNQEWGNYFENIRLSYRVELAELERCLELVFHN
jgi:PLD-like domain